MQELQRRHHEERMELQREYHGMQVGQYQERMALEEEMREAAKRQYEERLELQKAQNAAQMGALQEQIGYATELHNIQEEYLNFQMEQEQERINHAKDQAKLQKQLSEDQLALQINEATRLANFKTFMEDDLAPMLEHLDQIGVDLPPVLENWLNTVRTISSLLSNMGSGGGGGGAPPFPANPHSGQIFDWGGHRWVWIGSKWDQVYHEGTAYVTTTGQAQVQAGEMIVPAREVAAMIAGRGWDASDEQLGEIIRLLIQILAAINRGALVINMTTNDPAGAMRAGLDLYEMSYAG